MLYPSLLRTVAFDFHEVAFAIPLIAWSIYFIEEKHWRSYAVAVFLLLMVKENMGMVVVFIGVYLLLKRYYRYAIATAIAGISWFFIATKVLIPYFAGPGKVFNYWTYDSFGPNLPTALLSIVKNPTSFFVTLTTPFIKVVTFVKTFGITLGLGFFSPIIVIAIPTLLERFLSTNQEYWKFNHHYGGIIAPVAIMATIDALHRINRSRTITKISTKNVSLLAGVVIVLLSFTMFAVSPYPETVGIGRYSLDQDEQAGYTTLRVLADSAHICTTHHIAPHLGKHELTLIGDPGDSGELSCEYIVMSTKLDQSNELTQDLDLAFKDGFKLTDKNMSWRVYKR